MTQDKIVAMAREAGLHKMVQVKHVVEKVYEIPSAKLTQFAQLVAEHEREACAKVCEENVKKWADGSNDWCSGQVTGSNDCAAAIRARGEK